MQPYGLNDYLPPEIINDTIETFNYWENIGDMQTQGLIMVILIAGIVIFKLYNKLKAPTKKPKGGDY